MEELEKLKDVFQFGFITEAEFNERKKAILIAHNLPLEEESAPLSDSTPTAQENGSYSSPTSYSSWDESTFTSPSYDQPSYDSLATADTTSYDYDTSSYNSNSYNAYDTTSFTIPQYDTSNSTPNYDSAYNSVPTYDTEFDSNHAIITSFDHSNGYNEVSSSDSKKDNTQTVINEKLQEPSVPHCIIRRIAIEPKNNNLSSLSSTTQHSEEHYVDDTKAKTVIYLNERHGAFQIVVEPNLTLGSILKSVGVTFGSLLKLDLTKKVQPIDNFDSAWGGDFGSVDWSSYYTVLSNELEKVPAGHYKLIRNFSAIHRSNWNFRVDRQSIDYRFLFDPLAYVFFTRKVLYDSDEEIYSEPVTKRNCAFSGDSNPDNLIPHFLICLRSLENKWGIKNETLAIKKIKKSIDERVCYFCGGAVYQSAPFCETHSDETLSKLFSSDNVSRYLLEVEPQQQVQEAEPNTNIEWSASSPVEATSMYEKYVKKEDQYRYVDFSSISSSKNFLTRRVFGYKPRLLPIQIMVVLNKYK